MRIVMAGAVAALLVPGATLGAQDEPVAIKPKFVRPQIDPVADSSTAHDSAAARRARPNCWRAQPRPACNGFFLTEMGIETPMLSTAVRDRRAADGTFGPRRALHVGLRSTRLSETFLKLTAVALVRAALGAVGVEWDDSESDEEDAGARAGAHVYRDVDRAATANARK